MKRKVCNICHIAFDNSLDKCPKCKREIRYYDKVATSEGKGRLYGAGGAACDYCPECYGNENWCPFMD